MAAILQMLAHFKIQRGRCLCSALCCTSEEGLDENKLIGWKKGLWFTKLLSGICPEEKTALKNEDSFVGLANLA